MSMSIFSVTKGGYELSLKLHDLYPNAQVYASKKFGEPPHYLMDGNFKACVEEAFSRDKAIVFIMATGIVVRSIAPLLKSKVEDPAIVVLDEKGNNVISLLSGHIGGGNALSHEIADAISSNAVITTSSDVQNKIAVDVLAIKNNLIIDSMKDATEFASCVVNDQALVVKTEGNFKLQIDDQWTINPLAFSETDNILYIGNRITEDKKTLWLIPRNIVIGIGCRRDTEKHRILEAIASSLESLSLDRRSIKNLSTVDVKADEIGLLEAAAELKLPLEIINREEIKTIQDEFEGSDFVEKTIGVRVVSEAVAKLSSKKHGRFLMDKTSYGGITIAIWEEEYEIR